MQLFGNDVIFAHRVSQCPMIVNKRLDFSLLTFHWHCLHLVRPTNGKLS